jgi:hypothetical protein
MSGTRSATGLMCSHGSQMDEKIPRPKMPKSALPPELRRKMGFEPRKGESDENNIYQPGSGVLAPVGSGKDGSYLKMKSGVPMSYRTSGLARMQGHQGSRALIPRAKILEDSTPVGGYKIKGMR